jgi:predicted nucleic acid-binding protein
MPPNKILVDSRYLFALFAEKSDRHQDAIALARIYQGQFLIPYVVLTEVAYLFNREGGIPAVIMFLDRLGRMQPIFEITASDDLIRVRAIMSAYRDSKFDFVDCCMMALSERLNITQVCTLDQRDFSIFRPKHCDYLEILP